MFQVLEPFLRLVLNIYPYALKSNKKRTNLLTKTTVLLLFYRIMLKNLSIFLTNF